MSDSYTRSLVSATVTFLVLNAIAVSLRLYVRLGLVKAFGWDDVVLVLAYVSFLPPFCQLATTWHQTWRKGVTKDVTMLTMTSPARLLHLLRLGLCVHPLRLHRRRVQALVQHEPDDQGASRHSKRFLSPHDGWWVDLRVTDLGPWARLTVLLGEPARPVHLFWYSQNCHRPRPVPTRLQPPKPGHSRHDHPCHPNLDLHYHHLRV